MVPIKKNDALLFHFRVENRAKAGATVVFLPNQMRFGLALCCNKDNFNRSIGTTIAFARAEGKDCRPRRRRFDTAPTYNGPMTLESIRARARDIACRAAIQVDNPVQSYVNNDMRRDVRKPHIGG